MCSVFVSEMVSKKVAEVGNIEITKIEIKKEKVCQNDYSGIGVVVYGWKMKVEKLMKNH